MSYPGLALEQAPPIGAPFRFFLTAPLFGLAAAALLLWLGPPALASRWNPGLLALTHLLTLGVLAMVMFGALLQMLPVVAGAPVARPRAVATVVHLLLGTGTLVLAAGFVMAQPWLLWAALPLLAFAVGVLAAAALSSLARAPRRHAAVRGMTYAVVALAVASALGLWLLAGHGGGVTLARGMLTDLHAGWALLGWVGLLVVGVAFQVVPMFQMTPEYPGPLTCGLVPGLFAALLLWSLGAAVPVLAPAAVLGAALLLGGFAAFALVTLDLQRRRKRRLPDVTHDFWRLGMACLLLALLLWLIGHAVPGWRTHPGSAPLLGGLVLLGFALSVVNGMLYKIVPFLVWFHLQNRLLHLDLFTAGERVPHMKQVLPDAVGRRQLRVHALALALWPPALLWPAPLVYPFALLLGLSFALLTHNLWRAGRLYRATARRLDAAAATRSGA